MSSKLSNPPPGPHDLSPEECEEIWASFESSPQQLSVPDWHMEILEERLARDCVTGMKGTPWEEFEKELFELLMKG
jgi:hypothetical protein